MTTLPVGQVGLIGWPVEHSVSPAMHNAAFEALGLGWRYVLLPTPPGEVRLALAGLKAQGYHGANVTVPHKEAVIPYLDELDSGAQAIGAVNTIVLRDGRLTGHNTDGGGFLTALREAAFEPAEKRVLVVGAGGAARALVYGLLGAGVREVGVLNRTVERAQALAAKLEGLHSEAGRVYALPLTPEALVESARAADLLVNATTAGMWPDEASSIWPDGVPVPAGLAVFDLVYNPSETRLLRQARQSGAQAIGGLEMLVRQGALAFTLWTGRPAPVDVMRAAARLGLMSRSRVLVKNLVSEER